MTREEFTDHWWRWSNEHQLWYKRKPVTLEQAQNFWWFNPWIANNWRLSRKGFEQLNQHPFDQQQIQSWDMSLLYNSTITLKLSRLHCPWDLDLDRVSGREYVVTLWLYGEQENVWMNLCGGNVSNFLDTWQY